MKNKKSYFTSSKNPNAYTFDYYLAESINNLWKRNNNDNNNDDDDNNKFNVNILSNVPLDYRKYKLKNRCIEMEKILKDTLQEFYNKGEDILNIKRPIPNSKSIQTKYSFTDKFSKIILKAVEVNCRMITTNMANQGGSISSYNLSRIGNITFKGEMKLIIDELMEKCKRELEEKFCHKITTIRNAAMYIPEHKDQTCGWRCVKLEENIKKKFRI